MESLEDRFLTPSLRSARKEKNAEEIDIEEGRNIKQTLDKKGFDLFYKEYDIGHEISTDVIEDLSNWLEKN